KAGRKQTTSRSSRFLDSCRNHIEGKLSKDDLLAATVRLGFNNVIDAFHIVNRAEIPVRFFTDARTSSQKGIVLCDELYRLKDGFQFINLPEELEGRWRLVETAWDLNVSRNLIAVRYDANDKLLYAQDRSRQRVNVTSCRTALNGYQKGKCFYCFADITIAGLGVDRADVDHFLPHRLRELHDSTLSPLLDGVWNLVLACVR